MQGITPNGLVYNDFDIVDIAIITDKSLDQAYDQLEQQAMDDIMGISESTLLNEETNDSFIVEKANTDNIDTEDSSDISMLGMEAEAYIDAMESFGNDTIGDMIDLVAGI